MHSFALIFENDGHGEPKRIEFTASDCHYAFDILRREKNGRRAILWQGKIRVGTLQCDEAGVWQLAS